MTIVYDAKETLVRDEETGLAVQFVERGYPKEATEFFKFIAEKRSYDFSAGVDTGWSTVERMFPDLSLDEKFEKLDELNERNYSIDMNFFKWNNLSADELANNISVFYELFMQLALNRLNKNKIRISSYGELLPRKYWREKN
jgi:hypothetical protein